MIVNKKTIDELEYNILGDDYEDGFLVKLRDSEGLDKEKVSRTYELLKEIFKLYKGSEQVDKKVIRLIVNIPEQMRSFIEWNLEDKKEIEDSMIDFNHIIWKILQE